MRTVLAAALCLASFAASAQLYRWTDDKGRVHVTDTPPPAAAKSLRQIGDAPASEAVPSGQEPFELQQAKAKYPVTLYSTPGCDACAAARKLLNTRGIPFREISVNDNARLEELKALTGETSVPAMLVGRSVQRGFEAGIYERTLDVAGYPKVGVLPPRNQAEPAPPPQPGAPEVKPVEEPERPSGPYAPGAPPQKRSAQR